MGDRSERERYSACSAMSRGKMTKYPYETAVLSDRHSACVAETTGRTCKQVSGCRVKCMGGTRDVLCKTLGKRGGASSCVPGRNVSTCSGTGRQQRQSK